MTENKLFQQSNQNYDTPLFAEDAKIHPKPETKKIRTIVEKKKIKIVEKKTTKNLISDNSEGKLSSFTTPQDQNKLKRNKTNEKTEKKSSSNLSNKKSNSGYLSASKNTKNYHSLFRRCIRFLFGITRKLDRVKIYFGGDSEQDPIYRHSSNSVKTTKYTAINWFPKSLLIQFMKSANIYFLIITVLTAMPFSPKMPETMFLTFSAVLIFTQLKEAYEDYRRYLQDNEVNFKKVLCFDYLSNSFIEKEWMNLEVGEIVKVLKEEPFPADILFLKCSEKNGIAFVDTMNLDGETNLKEKLVFAETQEFEIGKFGLFNGFVECEAPNEFLEVFDGSISYLQNEGEYIPSSLSIKQLLLRGSILKNTNWIIGLTVFCGPQTKSYKNARKPRNKMSNILKKMNKILYSLFAFLGIICFMWTFAGISADKYTLINHGYLEQTFDPSFSSYIQRFCVYIVAYSQIIPISLYVALEIVKLMHAYLITFDPDLFYEPVKKKPNVKNSDLIEELGQVEMIFSDKTGTLTCNVMEFKKCIINDVVYGSDNSKKTKMPYHINHDTKAYQLLLDQNFNEEWVNIDNFFRVISICHTVVTDKDETENNIIKYQASSPDELALVEGARQMGYCFLGRDAKTLTLKIFDKEPEIWETLVEFPFDSHRKRMSMIVKNVKTNQYFIMTKGADAAMIPRINKDKNTKLTEEKLNLFAMEGLRTLVIAQKSLKEQEYNEFWSEYQQLKVSSEKSKVRKILKLYDLYERNLDLVGVSGIEDKLQEGVPDTIYKLIEADIKIWVLTGDKQETAIEIGKSCKLIQPDMDVLILTSNDVNEVTKKIKNKCEQFDIRVNKPLNSLYKMDKKIIKNRKIAIVIDGSTLSFITADANLKNYFFRLGIFANSCICCRVSPKQKADVVKLAKSYGNWITLAIGDGANDVAMITEAHIGVGIFGKEGTQAARSADFAICQFKYLEKLLLVHGRWNYRRISLFICYYFYKNCTMVFTEIFFAFFNGFSGQIFFLDWLPMLFNAVWTSWPCIINSLLDQDVSADMSLKYPKLFKAGPCSFYFNFKRFWLWILFGFWHGMCCFWLPVFFLYGSIDKTGDIESHWFVSIISFSVMMHIITIKLFMESNYYTIANISFGILGVIFYYLTIAVFNLSGFAKLLQPQMSGLFFHIINTPKCWLVMIGAPLIALLPDYLYLMFNKINLATPTDIIMKYNARKAKINNNNFG